MAPLVRTEYGALGLAFGAVDGEGMKKSESDLLLDALCCGYSAVRGRPGTRLPGSCAGGSYACPVLLRCMTGPWPPRTSLLLVCLRASGSSIRLWMWMDGCGGREEEEWVSAGVVVEEQITAANAPKGVYVLCR